MRNDFQEEVYQEQLAILNQAIKVAEQGKEDAMDKWDTKIEELKYDRDEFVGREESGGYEG